MHNWEKHKGDDHGHDHYAYDREHEFKMFGDPVPLATEPHQASDEKIGDGYWDKVIDDEE